jgi:integrase/recombinase XerD
MAWDLALKNFALATQKEYLRCCCRFVRYRMTSPDENGTNGYQAASGALEAEGAGPETLRMNVAALKFLYGVTLDRPKVTERFFWPKVPQKKS